MRNHLTPDQIGVPIMEALGIRIGDGVVRMILTMEYDSLPTLEVMREVKDDVDPEKVRRVLEKYELVKREIPKEA